MIRVLRHYRYIRISIFLVFIALYFEIGACISDELPFTSLCRYTAGILLGILIELLTRSIDMRKKDFEKMNTEPNFNSRNALFRIYNEPLKFGLANDFIGKDLLYYLPYKISLYTMNTQIHSFLHTMFVSYNKHTDRIRVFDIINKNNCNIDESESYFIRITYDIYMSISNGESITIRPLQVVFYDRDEKKALVLDNDIFRLLSKTSNNISQRDITWACNICEHVMKDYTINGFDDYFKLFLHNNHLTQTIACTRSFSHKLDIRNLNKDANIEVIDDDFLSILRDLMK